MWVYVVLLFVPLIIQHAVYGKKNVDLEKKNKNALNIFFILFTVLLMLRHENVGNDTKNYIYFFENYARMDWATIGKDPVEIGFSYFNKIVSVLKNDPQFFLAVTAVLTVLMIYFTYRRLCLDSSLTIVLFCTMSTFVMAFSGIRQMLAVGLGFIAYEFTRNKKILMFILVVLLAMSFHTSAFILAFMYPLYHAKITKNWLYIVVPVLMFIFVMNKPIFSFLTVIIARYTKYEGEITSTGAYTMLILFVIFTAFSFLIPDESKLDAETIGLRNFLLVSLAVQMFAPLHNLAMRMNYYYIIFIPLLMPKIVHHSDIKWKQIAVVGRHVMVIFFLVYFFKNASDGGNLNVFPYHFFWENI